MTPGLSADLLEVNDARKTAVINKELYRLQIDIVALQKTRLPTTDSMREKDFTFFWQGKPPEQVREHGVGFAIRNRLLGSIVPPTEGSGRIIKLQLHTAAGMVSFINAYAPTLTSSMEAKDEFYDDLCLTLRGIPQQAPVFLLGDFNARVG
ncbi:craniofacial development protein 2-like [Procambarus clarkii]|uniref:craniofacial development protein 2-like n=1 Tax=Procambarus clarkii TaxID=6728 RepID=UPI003744A47B